MSETQYSIVDSGTTVTIKSDDGATLIDLNPNSKIRIVGLNGSVSSSKGKGLLVGFAKAASGKTVECISFPISISAKYSSFSR